MEMTLQHPTHHCHFGKPKGKGKDNSNGNGNDNDNYRGKDNGRALPSPARLRYGGGELRR